MAHLFGGQFKKFISAGTAFRMQDEAPAIDEDLPSRLPWPAFRMQDEAPAIDEDLPSRLPGPLNGEQATGFYVGLISGHTSNSVCSSTHNITQDNECRVETLSSDEEEDDSEIQIVECKRKKYQHVKREDDLHVVCHKKKSAINNDGEDDIQIIDDEDCSIVSCTAVISKNITSTPPLVTNPRLSPVPQPHHWCILCGGYFSEGKDVHEKSIVHKVIVKDASTPHWCMLCQGYFSKGKEVHERSIIHRVNMNDASPRHWCILCQGYFSEGKEAHERSIVHKVNVNDASPAPQLPPSFNYTIPPNNKGYQMLLGLGWDQSKGLGKDGKGVKSPVKTILKLDRSGLGNSPEPARVSHFAAGDLESGRSTTQERTKRKLGQTSERENMMTKRINGNKIKCAMPSEASFAEKQKEYEIRKEIYNF